MEGDPDTFLSVQRLTQSMFFLPRIPYFPLPPFSPFPLPSAPSPFPLPSVPSPFPLPSVPSNPLFRSLLPFSLSPTSLFPLPYFPFPLPSLLLSLLSLPFPFTSSFPPYLQIRRLTLLPHLYMRY